MAVAFACVSTSRVSGQAWRYSAEVAIASQSPEQLRGGWVVSEDVIASIGGKRLDVRARIRAGMGRAGGELRPANRMRLLLGELHLVWAAGCFLTTEEWLPFGAPPRMPALGALPLIARTTVAWREREHRGGLLQLPVGPANAALWVLQDRWGTGLGCGPVAVAVARFRDEEARGLRWSLVFSADRGDGSRSSLLLECTGSSSTASMSTLGGRWQARLPAVLGAFEGAFRFRGRDEDPLAGPEDHGWFLRWLLPVMRGVAPRLDLLCDRTGSATRPVPTERRSVRLALAAEPWSGAVVRLAASGVQRLGCRGVPGETGQKAFLREARSVLDVRADIRALPAFTWTFAYRHVSGELRLDDGGIPQELTPVLDATTPTEPAGDLDLAAQRWSLGTGGILWARLRWSPAGAWRGGITLAATPMGGRGSSAVPVRRPPGRSLWRTLGSGQALLETWASCRAGAWVFEGAIHLISGAPEEATVISSRFGVRTSARL